MLLPHHQSHLSLRNPSTQSPPYHKPFGYNATASSSTHKLSPSRSLSTQDWISTSSNLAIPTQSDYAFGNCHDGLPSNSNYILPPTEDQQRAFDHDSTHQSQSFNNLRVHVQTPFTSSTSFTSSGDVELMQSDQAVLSSSWTSSNGQLTPISGRSHYRESSLSSLGSAGPASPFNGSTTSHPQVLLPSDSIGEHYYDGLSAVDNAQYHHSFSKPLTPSQTPSQESFLIPPFQGYINTYGTNQHIATMMAMQERQASGEDGSMQAPEYSQSNRPSVASTHESPATPPVGEDYEDRKPDFRSANTIPTKLDRTMSDIYNDELYGPSFTYTPAPSTKSTEGALTASRPQSDVFAQRLQAANRHHLSASSRSPLLESPQDSTRRLHGGSPLAPMLNTFGSPSMRINSAKQMREKQKAESDARALQQQMQRSSPQQATPKTISPKDAMLEFHETEQDAMMPLCSPHASQYVVGNNSAQEHSPSDVDETASQRSFATLVTSRRESSSAFPTPSQAAQQQGSLFNFIPPPVPERLRIPQQYPFMPQQRRMQGSALSLGNCAPDFPSNLSLVECGTGITPEESDLKKPTGSTAEGGTYTCTYHGCTLRFETPAKLQKHKREGHRQSVPVAGGRGESAEGGMTSAALRDSQAGPHYCKRNNPSTGKPCNTAFSRPYDLTRHEDTIHNARKQKVRCQLCTEEKTFSRNDALTRHMRVVHPEVDFSGKARRRGHD